MTNEEKQELTRKVWIASSILGIVFITGFFPGHWFLVFCFIGVAWPVEKKIEELFSEEIDNARQKLFGFFNVVYRRRIEPTWLGRFLDNTFPPLVANDLEETELESVVSITSINVSNRSEQSRHTSDSGSYSEISTVSSIESDSEENLSVSSADIDRRENAEVESIASTVFSSQSTQSSTRRISSGLGQSISSQSSNFTTELSQSGYDSDTRLTDDEEDFILTENDDQLTVSLQQTNEPNLPRSLIY